MVTFIGPSNKNLKKTAQLGSSILLSEQSPPLRPLPSASLRGGGGGCVDMPLLGACTYGLCLTSKRGHKGRVPPPTPHLDPFSSQLILLCVNVFVCLTLTLHRPL